VSSTGRIFGYDEINVLAVCISQSLFTNEIEIHDRTSHPLVRRVHSLALHILQRRAGNEPVIITVLTLLPRMHVLLHAAMIFVRHRVNPSRTYSLQKGTEA